MPGSGLFRVLLRLQIHPGMEREFETTWLGIGDAVAGQPAIGSQWLLRSCDEPATYYIVSDWADEQQFRDFEHSQAHAEHRRLLNRFRSGVSMTTTTVVCHLPPTPAVAGEAAVPGGAVA